MPTVLELSIIPLDKETILSHYLARLMATIRESGLAHQFCPLSALVEGEWDELMARVWERRATRGRPEMAARSRGRIPSK